MSEQDQGHDGSYYQASTSLSGLGPSMNSSTDLTSQQVYAHQWYPPTPVDSSGMYHNFTYTNNDYFPPVPQQDGYTEQYFNHYHRNPEFNGTSHYRNPSSFTYMPGTPLQANNFESTDMRMARDFPPDNPSWNQLQTGNTWNEKRTYQPIRGRRKDKFQGRGQHHGNIQGHAYTTSEHDSFYGRDDYYYETPYQNSGMYTGRRGNPIDMDQRGRRSYNYQNAQFRLGDGDGNPHRRRYEPRWTDNDFVSGNRDTLTGPKTGQKVQAQKDRSKFHSSQVFESQAMKSDSTQGNHTEDSYMDQMSGMRLSNTEFQEQVVPEKFKPSGNETFNVGPQSGSRRQDQVPDIRGRGHVTGRNGKKVSSANEYRSADSKKPKSRIQEHDTAENDENQRVTLTEQLSSSKYECMVCCDNILPESPVWSCLNCYHVFHLSCIQKWARSSLCKDTKTWRCPGCQNVSPDIPSQYRCFCGRRRDPLYRRGETAHSCGEICRRRKKGSCRHPCTILCHPGPCPLCCAMVWLTCDCGKVRKHVRCSTAISFKCDKICEKTLRCGDHKCQDVCHTGPCSQCLVSKAQECFCKKMTREVMCGTEEFLMTTFSCEKPCGRTLGCGNHICEESCHPGECAPCALMPGNLQFCCCGKTPIAQLQAQERESCLDTVPTCGQICNKPMTCGSPSIPHLCENHCHPGDCGPCSKETLLKCECGATEKMMPCEQAVTFNEHNPFKCQRRCGKKKTCGRHKCSDSCCVKDIHICEIVCGRKLSCGIHKCEELCHRGNCKRCLQASFEELTCYCGAELLEPPVPCGTQPPECRKMCTRQHDCDHPVRHYCHMEEVCPPCTDLTDKTCVGGHMVRKNVPCHMTNISCGYPCAKMLTCGLHKCQKICHKGECLEQGAACAQQCEKVRLSCGHPCGAQCHSGPCPDTSCKTEITITCPCGNRTAKALCSLGGDSSVELAQFQRLSVQSMAESGGQSVDLSQFTQTKKSNKRLECDANCSIMERNRRLALSLQIKNPDISAKLGNPSFTEFLKDYAKKNPKFAISVEKSLTDLVQSAKQSAQPNRSHAFQSMNRDQRRFVHELAEFYGCQTQSYDYEPNKNVVATAVKEKCWLPNATVTQLVLKDQLPKVPPPISSFKTQGVTFTVLEKKKAAAAAGKDGTSSSRAWEDEGAAGASVKQDPVVDYFDFSST